MSRVKQLEDAIVTADQAGDEEGARVLADELRAEMAKTAAPAPGFAQTAGSAVGKIGRGFARGAAFNADMLKSGMFNPGTALLSAGIRASKGLPLLDSSSSEAVESMMPTPPKQGGMADYANAGLEGLGGLAAGGMTPGGSMRQIIAALMSSVGAEGGEKLFGPLGAFAGGLAGGSAAGVGGSFRKNANDLAQDTLHNVKPQDLDAARENMIWAQQQGAPATLSQAMPAASNIDDIVNFLAQSRHGGHLIDTLRAQPEKLAAKATQQADQLPGQVRPQQEIANEAQTAATDVIDTATKRARSAYTSNLVPGAKVPAAMTDAFSRRLDDFITANPNNQGAIGMANEVKKRLQIQGPATGAKLEGLESFTPAASGAKQPLDDPNQLKSAVEDAIQGYGRNALNTGAVSKDLNRYASEIRKMWKETVRAGTPGMEAAAQASRKVFVDEVEPLKKSVVGRVAGVSGDSADREATDKLTALFNRGTPGKAASSEILTLERELRAKNPQIFVDAVKTNIDKRLTSALSYPEGRMPQDMAKRLSDAFAKNADMTRGLDDMLAGVARSRGVDESTYVNGFKNFIRLSGMMMTRPEKVSGLSPLDVAEQAGKSKVATVIKTRVLDPGYQFAKKIESTLSADAYSTISRLLDSPEGLDTLQRLSKTSVMSPSARSAIAAFYGFVGQQGEPAPE